MDLTEKLSRLLKACETDLNLQQTLSQDPKKILAQFDIQLPEDAEPPIPTFYSKPQSIDDLASCSLVRVLNLFDLDLPLHHWGEKQC